MGKLRNIVIISMLIICCGQLEVTEAQLLSEIPSKEKIAWGPEKDGVQLGSSFDLKERPYRQGEQISFKMYIQNIWFEQ